MSTEPQKPAETPEAPEVESIKVMAYIFNDKAKPIIYTLFAIGIIFLGALWLDSRAHDYIEKAADEATAARMVNNSNDIKALQITSADHEIRMRSLESTVNHIDASVTELLRRDDARQGK